MHLTFQSLSEKNASIFIKYLDNMDFKHAPDWAGCFCRFYHTDCPDLQWKNRTPSENMDEALREIQEGHMKGFLAFSDGECVGWVNANKIEAYPRLKGSIENYINSKQTAGIVCFVIHPDYRGMGIARNLLKEAISQLKKQGYKSILAFPFSSPDAPQKAYHGTLKMYLENGFKVLESRGTMSVVRKQLD